MKRVAVGSVKLRVWNLGVVMMVLMTGLGMGEEGIFDLEKLRDTPALGDGFELPIVEQELVFSVERGRRYLIPLRLKGGRSVEVRLMNAHDNTGDQGVTWRLTDFMLKKTYGNGFSRAKKMKKWEVKDIDALNVILVVEDQDTKFDGKWPGNRVRVTVR